MVSVSEQSQISFHQLQDIYNTLTGKFESISNSFERPYVVNFENLLQLNHMISQACESYGARIKNESITIYHTNGSKEVFSSFERFSLYNKGNVNPVENVSIEYNILIIPSGGSKVVQYRIRINLISRAGLRDKSPGMFVGPVNLLKFLGQPVGRVSIEYVDYVAARHFMTQIMEWYEALEFNQESKILYKIQGVSHIFRTIIPASILFSLMWVGSEYLARYVGLVNVGLHFEIMFKLLAGMLAVWFGAGVIGRWLERSVDRIQPVSCVVLNKGDERVVSAWKKSNIFNSILR